MSSKMQIHLCRAAVCTIHDSKALEEEKDGIVVVDDEEMGVGERKEGSKKKKSAWTMFEIVNNHAADKEKIGNAEVLIKVKACACSAVRLCRCVL